MRSPAASRWFVLLAALLAAALTARLGFWQLDRARQKIALHDEIEQRGAQAPIAAADLARDSDTAAQQHYRPIRLQGRWLARHVVYLDNRQLDGRPGFIVLTPLLLAPGDAVLVQRGWVPRDREQRTRLVPVDTPEGEVSIAGRVAPPPSALFAMGSEEAGVIRQNVALADFAREIGVALRPLSIQQLEPLSAPTDLLQRRWPLPALDVGKHHGYAFQWFALSALITGLYVWFQLIRPRRRAAR